MEEQELLNKCFKNNETALTELYKRFSSKMYGLCLRYAKNKMDAQDLLHDGFVKVLEGIKTFRSEGSLEGWLKKIMINTAINFYKKKYAVIFYDIEEADENVIFDDDLISKFSANDLLSVIQELPEGYRLVFNLFAIEGYKHNEIAEILNISENTSKTQLMKARCILMNKIKKFDFEESKMNSKKKEFTLV